VTSQVDHIFTPEDLGKKLKLGLRYQHYKCLGLALTGAEATRHMIGRQGSVLGRAARVRQR